MRDRARADAASDGVLGLSASASVEVVKDVIGITFSTAREGSDANAVQTQLKQAIDAALAEAKQAVRPGQLDVQTGNFSLYPRYTRRRRAPGDRRSAAGRAAPSSWSRLLSLQAIGRSAVASRR